MIEIAKNKFVTARSLKGANIYQKEQGGKWRISFKIDTSVVDEQTQYSDAFDTEEDAKKFLANLTLIS